MPFGWSGQILRVDLSKMKSSTEDIEPYTQPFIGGRGVNVKIMYDGLDPKILPFDPENRLCLGPGVLSGTLAPACTRMKITSMSPNGLLANAGIGGVIPAEIRWAGYDNIVIQGKADKPVYLYIHDDSVEFKDASHIWGKDTYETQQIVKGEVGDSTQVMCIGPGGENLVSFGCIVTGMEGESAAGRGGFGAIMGSKNLKAIAVRGTRGIKIAKPEEFIAACMEVNDRFAEMGREGAFFVSKGDGGSFVELGDKLQLDHLYESGLFPIGNWEGDVNWDEVGRFGGGQEFWDQYAIGHKACFGCPVMHHTTFDVPGIGVGATKCVEWTIFAGPVWNNDRKVIFHATYLCNRYGLDVVSTGDSVSFLMELYHKGIITEKDTDGIPMKRGDENAIISAIHKIGKQEGFGKLFRKGVLEAARMIGKGAEEYAMVVKGLEIYPHELRSYHGRALAAAVATRDQIEDSPTFEHGWVTNKAKMEKLTDEFFASKEAAIPSSYAKKALMVWDSGNRHCVGDMLGVCRFFTPWFFQRRSFEIPAKLFSLATGRDTNEEELLIAAQRTKTMERAFNVIKGIRRKDDTLPKRIFETAAPGGPFKGVRLEKEKFDKMLDEYYALRGWDEDGVPTEETFNKFGLSPEWKVFKKKLGKEGKFHG
ncbi:putative oxidoreductase YdhV [subsurface metagenome]